jgi:hypothetical protein
LKAALGQLVTTPYREVGSASSLQEAQHEVAAELLWNLRVLAGWLPTAGAELLRVVAGWFEIANVQDRLAYFAGDLHRPPFRLGGLATAWPRLALTTGPEQLRAVLSSSAWGDPGTSEAAGLVEALRVEWARRLLAAVPEARGWVRAAAALKVARDADARRPNIFLAPFARLAGLAPGWEGASSAEEVAALLPPALAWVLEGLDAPGQVWQAEARWWARVEAEAARLASRRRRGPATVVGVAGLLAADAWRVRAALVAAARGGGAPEVFDAVA